MKKKALVKEIERLRDVVRTRNGELNAKDDAIHNIRRALYKRDCTVDQTRAERDNLKNMLRDARHKIHSMHETFNRHVDQQIDQQIHHTQEENEMGKMNRLSQDMDEAGIPQDVRDSILHAIAMGHEIRDALQAAGHEDISIKINGRAKPEPEEDHEFITDFSEARLNCLRDVTTDDTPDSNEVLYDLIRAAFNDHKVEYRGKFGVGQRTNWMPKTHSHWNTDDHEYRLAQ